MTHIKICGIREEEHARMLAEIGVDFIGVMFASSPRQVSRAQARKISATAKETKNPPQVVGVFVNTPVSTIRKTVEICKLDRVQLSGDEPWEFCCELDMPIIKVIRVGRNYTAEQIYADLEYGDRLLTHQEHIFQLDASARDKYGGTGIKFDWKLAVPIAERLPVVLAGGLTPDNVKEAIRTVRPWGVDVSSGVETKGVKDMKKIIKFIENVKEADDRRS